jgi:glycosyltransferase involved in cell wall biosynthesis
LDLLHRFRNRGYRTLPKEYIRSVRDVGIAAPFRFSRTRNESFYQDVYDLKSPLVSICIATYNRADLLLSRAVASSICQTYENIEILVVGDCCTDHTVDLMAEVTDPRVIFINLPERGKYPEDPKLRWLVAGYAPFDLLTSMAKGNFITHLDHDDEYMPDRIEKLVRFIQETRSDLVYHPFLYETADDKWLVNEANNFFRGSVTTSSIIYHNWFRKFGADPLCYRYNEPGDWNRFRKIRYIGAEIRRCPDILLRHYKEQSLLGKS